MNRTKDSVYQNNNNGHTSNYKTNEEHKAYTNFHYEE